MPEQTNSYNKTSSGNHLDSRVGIRALSLQHFRPRYEPQIFPYPFLTGDLEYWCCFFICPMTAPPSYLCELKLDGKHIAWYPPHSRTSMLFHSVGVFRLTLFYLSSFWQGDRWHSLEACSFLAAWDSNPKVFLLSLWVLLDFVQGSMLDLCLLFLVPFSVISCITMAYTCIFWQLHR